jgi:enoyl ACP reductase
MTGPSFTGRRYLVTGVLNEESIAWHAAAALQRHDAQVVLTSFGRAARLARKAAALLPEPAELLELDVTRPEMFDQLARTLTADGGRLDGAVHCIAAAESTALGGRFLDTGVAALEAGFRISVASFQQLTAALLPLLSAAPGGGSVVGLTVDSVRALPGYDWMGVYKAALDATTRYTALYAGPHGVRANLVASGPLVTVSAQAVPSFDDLARYYEEWAPLGWDRADPEQVVGAILFLLSDWSRSTSGQILHADGGTHAVAGGIGKPSRQ